MSNLDVYSGECVSLLLKHLHRNCAYRVTSQPSWSFKNMCSIAFEATSGGLVTDKETEKLVATCTACQAVRQAPAAAPLHP